MAESDVFMFAMSRMSSVMNGSFLGTSSFSPPLPKEFILTVIGSLALYVCVHYFIHGSNYPGAHIWPVVGCLPSMMRTFHRVYDEGTEMMERSKTLTFVSKICGLNEIVTANPTNVEYVLKTNFQNYPKGPPYQEIFRDLLGHGIFNSDGEVWKGQRKTASLEFSTGSLRRLIVTSVADEVSHRLLPTLRQAMEREEPLDMQDVLLRYTFDNICRIGFGVDPGCLSPDLPVIPFAKAFDHATQITLVRNLTPNFAWKFFRWLQCGWESDLTKAIKAVHGFADGVVEKRLIELAEMKNREGDATRPCTDSTSDEHSDLLSRFILLGQQSGKQEYSNTFLRDVCTNFILAGRDTSSVALSWFFWLLTSHPNVEEKIHDEIDRILAARDPCERSNETFTFDELRSMQYLHAALTESLRLYPSVPVDTKYVIDNDTLPDGTFVPKGWRLTYSIYAMGRMTRVWGPDAREFKPERWLGRDGQFQPESPFKFLSFNAGPRLCLGRDMAYVQMKSVAGAVLRNFHLKLVPGHPVQYQPSLTLFMKHGLLMTVHPR